jgi:DNA-binding Xre family transcriptional regulator
MRRARSRKKRPILTRFGRFMRDNAIKPLQLADATGVSRQHLYRLRVGQADATRDMMILLTIGCRCLLGHKRVRVTDLFELEGRHP